MMTGEDTGAVQLHQIDPPLEEGGWKGSPFSLVAFTRLPVKVIEEPERIVRLVKLSFSGTVWQNDVDDATWIRKAPKKSWLTFIFRFGGATQMPVDQP